MTAPFGRTVVALLILGGLGLTSCGTGDCGTMPSLGWSGAFVGRHDDSQVTIDEASGTVVIERTDPEKGRVVTTWRVRTKAEYYAARSHAR